MAWCRQGRAKPRDGGSVGGPTAWQQQWFCKAFGVHNWGEHPRGSACTATKAASIVGQAKPQKRPVSYLNVA